MATSNVSLKLFIDKKNKRLLFAEAGKDFVDFLYSIFTLPVGAVTRLLNEGGGMVGSLPSLYQSIEDMSVTHIFEPDKNIRFLLEPMLFMPGAKFPLLLPNVHSTFCHLYRCTNTIYRSPVPDKYLVCNNYVADDNRAICPSCNVQMERRLNFVDPSSAIKLYYSTSELGYVKGTVKYTVMDDLEVKPLSTCSLVTLLTQFNVKDMGDFEEKVVYLGTDERVKLLKASLQSKTVLTDVFLPVEIIKTEESVKNEGYVEV